MVRVRLVRRGAEASALVGGRVPAGRVFSAICRRAVGEVWTPVPAAPPRYVTPHALPAYRRRGDEHDTAPWSAAAECASCGLARARRGAVSPAAAQATRRRGSTLPAAQHQLPVWRAPAHPHLTNKNALDAAAARVLQCRHKKCHVTALLHTDAAVELGLSSQAGHASPALQLQQSTLNRAADAAASEIAALARKSKCNGRRVNTHRSQAAPDAEVVRREEQAECLVPTLAPRPSSRIIAHSWSTDCASRGAVKYAIRLRDHRELHNRHEQHLSCRTATPPALRG